MMCQIEEDGETYESQQVSRRAVRVKSEEGVNGE